MPGSKLSCNSFYMFMLEVKKREESKGKRFPRGLDDVNPLASLEWERMSQDAKAAYKEKARDYKSSQEFRAKKKQTRNRPQRTKIKTKNGNGTSSDESFSDEENSLFFDSEDEDKFYRRREQDRNNLKTALTWNLGADNLAKKVAAEMFYVFATQNYYETPDHDYAPAEIAMVEFALVKGIIRQYHAILKPIRVPDHYRHVIGNKVMETHKISPNCPPREARDDYRAVVDEMKSFYAGNKQPNQFRAFVLTKQFNSVQGAVKALRDKTGSKCFIPHEKVACVEDLFILMCGFKGSNPKRADLIGFSDLLTETNWDYEPRTLCSYHSHLQSKHCALAVARKTCYYLFERLKEVYGLTLTDYHIPPLTAAAGIGYAAASASISTVGSFNTDYFALHSIRPPVASPKDYAKHKSPTATMPQAIKVRSAPTPVNEKGVHGLMLTAPVPAVNEMASSSTIPHSIRPPFAAFTSPKQFLQKTSEIRPPPPAYDTGSLSIRPPVTSSKIVPRKPTSPAFVPPPTYDTR